MVRIQAGRGNRGHSEGRLSRGWASGERLGQEAAGEKRQQQCTSIQNPRRWIGFLAQLPTCGA